MGVIVAIVCATAGWFFARLVSVRCVMLGSIILICVTISAELYVADYLVSQGCKGNWMKGVSCPEWSAPLRMAVLHDIFRFLFVVYLTFIFPIVWIVSAIVELLYRVGVTSSPQHKGKSNYRAH